MAKIDIEWLDDHSDCDTCGSSWADGARVFIDGELALSLEPVAHCLGGAHFDEPDVLRRILAHLGHELAELR